MPVKEAFFSLFGVSGLLLGLAGAATIALYTHMNRRARQEGARSHWRTGLLLGATGMIFMGTGWALLCVAGPHIRSGILVGLGFVLCGAATVIYVVSTYRVGRIRSPKRYSLDLHTGGIYRVVRHPQALALCVLAPGIGLATGSVSFLVTVPLWMAFWTVYTYLEERNELLPVFGDEYRRYRESTPRIVPRLFRTSAGKRASDKP